MLLLQQTYSPIQFRNYTSEQSNWVNKVVQIGEVHEVRSSQVFCKLVLYIHLSCTSVFTLMQELGIQNDT